MARELMSFGIQKLWDLLSQEYERFQGFEDQVSELKRRLNLLQSFVKDADAKQHSNAVVKNCVEEIKEIICDGEDTIETFILMKKNGKESGIKKSIKRLACNIPNRRKNVLDLEGICTRISNVIQDMKNFGVQEIITDSGNMQPLPDRRREVRQNFHDVCESDFVGLEGDVKILIGKLVEQDNVQAVSITGMGGLGKTTLARQVFNHEDVKHKFDGLAWVFVSQDFNRKNVWQTILRKLKPKEQEKILEMTELTLQSELSRLLETSKTLIVLDDIWEVEHWELIKTIFSSKKGWKVLLTSRKEILPKGDETYINLKRECLSSENSWTLFQRIALPRNDESEFKIDKEMEEMGRHMVKHCQGLPLAIRVLGSLLAEKYTVHDWKRLSENIGSRIMGVLNFDDGNNVYHILSLSYEELPSYLKHCFLYLAHFSEDHEIEVEYLSYLWAAEGISKSSHNNGESIRDVADGCIEELLRRNMVIAERDVMTLRFETCRWHDMMREVCLVKAKGENFQIVGSATTSQNVEGYLKNPKLRSLFVWNYFGKDCMVSRLTLTRLQLMRVLDLSFAKFEGGKLPSSIGKLIHLRYLSLKGTKVSHLPYSLRNLKLLIYLNLYTWDSIFVPNVLMGMQELKYLELPRRMHEKTKLELRNIEKLETLYYFSTENSSIEDLRGMARLRFLRIYVDDETSLETLSASISGLKHLEFLSIEDRSDISSERRIEEGIELDFIHLKRLHLQLGIKLLRQQCFPSHLTAIKLWKCFLEEDPMPILEKLFQLKEVYLLYDSFSGRRMVCSGGGFPQLQELIIFGLNEWKEWIVEEGSMPLLHTLDIDCSPKLREFPDGLRFIYSLKKLKLEKKWKERLSEGGADFYKVQHSPSIDFCWGEDES